MRYLLLILIPLAGLSSAFAQTVGKQLEFNSAWGIQFESNLVKNPSAAKNTLGTTTSSATVTRDTTSTLRIDGKASFAIDTSANGGYVEFTLLTPSSEQTEGNCGFSGVFKGDGTLYSAQLLDGSSNVLTSVQLTNETVWRPFQMWYPCGASGSRKVRLTQTTAGTSPAINVGRLYYGRMEPGVGSADYGPTSYTPTFTGFGTVSTSTCTHSRQGAHLLLECTFTSGTSTGTEARVSLPLGLTSTTSSSAIRAVGLWWRGVPTTTAAHGGAVLIESGLGYLTFSERATIGSTATNPLVKAVGTSLLDSGDQMSFSVLIPISGWTTLGSALTPLQTDRNWSGYFDSTCSWPRTNAAYGDPTADATCALVSRSSTSSFPTVSALSGVLPGITFTPTLTGRIYVCAITTGYQNNGTNSNGIQLVDGSGNQISESAQAALVSNTPQSYPNCGFLNVQAGVSVTLKLQSRAGANTITIGNNGGNAVEWNIFYVSNSSNFPILLGGLTSKEPTAGRVDSSSVTCSGSSAVSGGELLSSIGNISSGACTLTFKNAFSNYTRCWANYNSSSASLILLNVGGISTSGATLYCRSQNGATTSNCTSVTADVYCSGAQP